MSRIPFPAMKYPLIAILRGLKPAETEDVVLDRATPAKVYQA